VVQDFLDSSPLIDEGVPTPLVFGRCDSYLITIGLSPGQFLSKNALWRVSASESAFGLGGMSDGEERKTLGNRFRVALAFEFLLSLDFEIFSFANALRLQEMKREGESHVKPLPAQLAANRELKQGQTRNIGKTYPGCSELGSATVGAIHREKPVFLGL